MAIDLITRWETEDGIRLRREVLKSLKSKHRISELGLDRVNDRWDLRGFPFPAPDKVEKIRSYDMVFGGFNIKHVALQDVDLSYANLSYTSWYNCYFENVAFENSNLDQIHLTCCDFRSVVFHKAKLSNAFLARNKGKRAGSFVDVQFISSNLSKSRFDFPIMENCEFVDCKLKEIDFDGSRFKNCRFKGLFESGWINGYAIYASTGVLGIFNTVNPKDFPNKMENVDFSEAELDDVLFQHGVDLTGCEFPSQNKYIIVKRLDKVYSKVTDVIERQWEGENRRVGLEWINNVYYSDRKAGMPMDIINTENKVSYFSDQFQDDFFDLIRQVNTEVNSALSEQGGS